MNKTILMAAAMLLLLFSCKKDSKLSTNESINFQTNKVLGTCGDFNENHFLVNTENLEDQQVNYALYYVAMAFREVLSTYPNLLSEIKTSVNAHHELDLNLFASNHQEIIPILNASIASFYGKEQNGFDYMSYLESMMVYENVVYAPFLYIPNFATADFGKQPYIAVGAQIDETVFPDKEDHIPVWYDLNNVCNFSTVGASEAMSLSNPLLIVVNGLKYEQEGIGLTMLEKTNNNQFLNPLVQKAQYPKPSFHQEVFKITRPFESSGNVDYTIGYCTEYSAPGEYVCGTTTYVANRAAVLAGSPFQVWRMIQPANGTFSSWNGVFNPFTGQACQSFVATFEYDWYASKKKLGTMCINGKNEVMKGNMKFDTDWYHFDPNTNTGFALTSAFPNNYHINYYYSPSVSIEYIKVWRID